MLHLERWQEVFSVPAQTRERGLFPTAAYGLFYYVFVVFHTTAQISISRGWVIGDSQCFNVVSVVTISSGANKEHQIVDGHPSFVYVLGVLQSSLSHSPMECTEVHGSRCIRWMRSAGYAMTSSRREEFSSLSWKR